MSQVEPEGEPGVPADVGSVESSPVRVNEEGERMKEGQTDEQVVQGDDDGTANAEKEVNGDDVIAEAKIEAKEDKSEASAEAEEADSTLRQRRNTPAAQTNEVDDTKVRKDSSGGGYIGITSEGESTQFPIQFFFNKLIDFIFFARLFEMISLKNIH